MARIAFALLLGAGTIACASAAAQTADCTKFRDTMARVSGDLKVDFVRPLVVSRGAASDLEQFDLISRVRIDGSLRCRGEVFVRFEATLHLPADNALIDEYASAQVVALQAALGWSQARALDKVRTVAADAAEFLRGSVERGDFVVAGKLEEHLPGGVDLGVVWTPTERTFLLLQND